MSRNLKIAEAPVPAVIENGRYSSGQRFRESRIKVPDGIKCIVRWRDYYGQEILAHVRDISRYGCRITLPPEVPGQRLFVKIQKGFIDIDGVVAYSGPITFVNERTELDGSVSCGITLEGSGCDLEALSAAATLKSLNIRDQVEQVLAISRAVKENFKILVADLNAMLQDAKVKLDRERKNAENAALSDGHLKRLEERIIGVALSVYGPKLQSLLMSFQELAAEFDVDDEAPHKQYFRLSFQNLIAGTPFVDRGIKKPLGYSGDYGMMVMLYEYADQGETLFNKFFHRFVCSEPAAIANKNRVGFLSDILIDAYIKAAAKNAPQFKITSLACGPAREIYEFLKFVPISEKTPITINLVDLEEHALDYAQARLRELSLPPKSVDLIFMKEDVVTGALQEKEFLNRVSDSDYIISAGLFDYLTDRVSQRVIATFFKRLKKGGELLVGNISKKSPDAFAMDYFMDWRLILRDENDLIRLVNDDVKSAGGVSEVTSESLGLNLFLKIKKD